MIVVVVVCWARPSARAETHLAADDGSSAICEAVREELSSIEIDVSAPVSELNERRARRRSFASNEVDALVVCRSGPNRIDVFYPDGSRLGAFAFAVSAENDTADAPVYVSERVRSERFIADVPVAIPFTPAVWWLGIGADAFFSPGGIAPLAFVRVDVGYRFHRHWSVEAFAAIQPYMRRLNAEGLETRLRLDQFGAGLSYHPLVRPRVDLALGVRAAAVRLGVSGTRNAQGGDLAAQRDAVWLGFPAGRISLRVGLTRRIWLNIHGETGAILPRVAVSGGSVDFGSVGELAVETGLSLEVHFR
ncbi:MAG: hypothetical protein JRE19_09205 [Deltaproteobacteria bacterium]|nr:hypothetical protein [Deltaproteobacteria bacterium]